MLFWKSHSNAILSKLNTEAGERGNRFQENSKQSSLQNFLPNIKCSGNGDSLTNFINKIL